jgi:hypothetical protein
LGWVFPIIVAVKFCMAKNRERIITRVLTRILLVSSVITAGLEGDVVFAFGDTSELEENVLWQALAAVRDERAFIVGYYWWGEGLLSAHDMLDDLFTYVAEVELTPELANPFEEGVFPPTD